MLALLSSDGERGFLVLRARDGGWEVTGEPPKRYRVYLFGGCGDTS
jgi:hypothetical protein